MLPLSGSHGRWGLEILSGLRRSLDYASTTHLGELSQKIQLIHRDSAGRASEGERQARELIETERVHVLLGGMSTSESRSYGEMARDHSVLFVSLVPRRVREWTKGLLMEPPGYKVQEAGTGGLSTAKPSKARKARDLRAGAAVDLEKSQQAGYSLSFAPSYSAQLELLIDYLAADLKLSPHEVGLVYPSRDRELVESPGFREKVAGIFSSAQREKPGGGAVDGHHGSAQQIAEKEDSELMMIDLIKTPGVSANSGVWQELGRRIIKSSWKATVMTQGWSSALLLLEKLERGGYGGGVFGLDSWDHPRFSSKAAELKLSIRYLLSYHPQFFAANFYVPSQSYGERESKSVPSSWQALGYDVMSWVVHMYDRSRSARVAAWTHMLTEPISLSYSCCGERKYQLGQDHGLRGAMALVSPGDDEYPDWIDYRFSSEKGR